MILINFCGLYKLTKPGRNYVAVELDTDEPHNKIRIEPYLWRNVGGPQSIVGAELTHELECAIIRYETPLRKPEPEAGKAIAQPVHSGRPRFKTPREKRANGRPE